MMDEALIVGILASTVTAATPLLFAAMGELMAERSGVLNLSIEGILLASAMAAFAVACLTLDGALGTLAGMLTGLSLGLLFAILTVSLRTDQIVTGLAMVILGDGISRFFGAPFVGKNVGLFFQPIPIPGLVDIWILGPVLFRQNWLVYGSYLLVPATWYFLYRTRYGLAVRATGEKPSTVEVAGHNAFVIRYACVIFGASMAGLAGAFLSLAYLQTWAEGMTAGRGWVALAVVILAGWHPVRVLAGAYLFGFAYIMAFQAQAMGGFLQYISTYVLQMFPYVLAVVVLASTSRRFARRRQGAPAALTLPYVREERI